MKPVKLLSTLAAIGLGATANAVVVTLDPMMYASGADVSTALPSVTLTRLRNVGGGVTYAPLLEPVIIGRCAFSYAVCSDVTSYGTIGAVTANVLSYRSCYNANFVGSTSLECVGGWAAIQAAFSAPVDFVEFELVWTIDPPMLLVYDATGAEILSCNPGWTTSSTSCYSPHMEVDTHSWLGTIRLRTKKPIIAKVVVGSAVGSAYVTNMQYNVVPAP